MTLNKVNLTWNLVDLVDAGQSATLTLVPDAQLTDPADELVSGEISKSVIFSGGTGSLAGIIATDNTQILPNGWAYTVTVTLTTGKVVVGPESIFIAFANGASQDLSALLATPAVPQLGQYLPLPSGTPSAGEVPVYTGPGAATAWGGGGGGGAVSSVFGRAGAVVAQSGDYTAAQVGAATPAAVAAETARAEAAEAQLLPLAGGTMSGPVAMGGSKVTGLGNGTAAQDAAAFGQTPAGGAIVSGQFLRAPNVYAPATRTPMAVTSTAMAAFSSGNACTGSFTAPPSGSVLVKASFIASNSAAASMAFGLCATGTTTPVLGDIAQFRDSAGSAQPRAYVCEWLVTGLTAGTAYNFDLMGAAASGDTVTVYAEAQTSTTPGLTAATDGGPVTMTVQAV